MADRRAQPTRSPASGGRRVLVTGLGTFWGGRVAQQLEADPGIEVLVGLDRVEPSIGLERTEFVRADESYSILSRIVKAARIDTIVHTFLVMDSTTMSSRTLHEINVIGTMNLLAAAGAAGSTVRTVIVKSATLVYGATADDPVWFREETPRSAPPRTRVERSLLEVEGYLRDFAQDNPHVTVSLLRFSNVLGHDIKTPLTAALQLPLVPTIAGFDPRFQFVEEGDVIRSILYVLRHQVPGVFNVAGDGLLPWSEVMAICGGKPPLYLPPMLTGVAADALRRLRIIDLPPEALDLLRYGRGVDNRRLKQAGFQYRYTSAGAIERFWQGVRLRRTVGRSEPEFVYDSEVESFFRHSPAVQHTDH
jgi:UDP-glucose 4-epimerase